MYVCMYIYIYIYVCFVVFLLSSNKSHELNIQISKAFYKNQSRFDASCWSSSLTGSSPTFVHKGLLRLVANVDFAVHQILKPRSSQGDVRQASVEVTPFFWDSRIPGYINSLHWFLSNHYHSSTVFFDLSFHSTRFFCGLTNLQEKKTKCWRSWHFSWCTTSTNKNVAKWKRTPHTPYTVYTWATMIRLLFLTWNGMTNENSKSTH